VAVHSRASVVTLAWDPSGPEVAGHRLYYGVSSRIYASTYSTSIDVGDATSCSVSNLVPGTTYFFAVTAYDWEGVESDYSAEIAYTPKLRIGAVSGDGNGTTLTWKSEPGTVVRVLFTPTLNNPVWTDVSGPILALSEVTSWTHAHAGDDQRAFYRLEMISLP